MSEQTVGGRGPEEEALPTLEEYLDAEYEQIMDGPPRNVVLEVLRNAELYAPHVLPYVPPKRGRIMSSLKRRLMAP